jgi:membrane protein implicated in regulation of membrane protease activity
MQSTLVLLSAHEDRRGGAMGILSACIGTQPVGTLWLGLLATGIGVAGGDGAQQFLALAAITPVAVALWRRSPRRVE